MPFATRVLSELSKHGFYVGDGWDAETMVRLCRQLGKPAFDRRNPAIVRLLAPQHSNVAPTNTLSSRYGLGGFPFHSETAYWPEPAAFVALLCVSVGSGRRPTLVSDLALRTFPAAERELLARALWLVKGRKPFLSAIADIIGDRSRLRYDRDCMMPATRDARIAEECLNARAADASVTIEWAEGRLLVIDNSRCLHGRGVSLVPDTDRVLARVLVRSSS